MKNHWTESSKVLIWPIKNWEQNFEGAHHCKKSVIKLVKSEMRGARHTKRLVKSVRSEYPSHFFLWNWVGKSGRLYQPFWMRTSRGESEKMSGSGSSVSHMSWTIHLQQQQKYSISPPPFPPWGKGGWGVGGYCTEPPTSSETLTFLPLANEQAVHPPPSGNYLT